MMFPGHKFLFAYVFFQYLSFWVLWMEQSGNTRTKVKKFHPPQRKPVGAPALGENEKLQRALERMRKNKSEWENKEIVTYSNF